MRRWGRSAEQHGADAGRGRAIVVAFRQNTTLPLDDVLGCLGDTVRNLIGRGILEEREYGALVFLKRWDHLLPALFA